MSQNLTSQSNPFDFEDLDVRTAIGDNETPWFCAKDVSAVLDITWTGHTLDNMPEEWQGVVKLTTPSAENGAGGGEQDVLFINEAGLFHLILRSNKPKAREFSNWVCGTVLPEIKQTGYYGKLKVSDQVSIAKQIDTLSEQIINTRNAYRRKLLQDQLRKLCNIVNQPVPPTEWIAFDYDQTDLFMEARR